MRLVIADDSADFREMLHALFRTSGRGEFDVVGEARTADEAVAVVCDQQPDALLLDVGMPGAGQHTIPAIRAGSPRTQVIVLSGFDREDVPDNGKKADAYILKGIPVPDMIEAIRRACQAG